MSTPKTLVIGSTEHQHVKCISWEDIYSINIVDFDLVVVNVRSLSNDFLTSCKFNFFDKIRTSLARLLASRGNIVVLGETTRKVPIGDYSSHTNYSWSPIVIRTVDEVGTTIAVNFEDFPKFFANFKKWDFYYYVPQTSLTDELTAVCGETREYQYKRETRVLAENRYSKMLSGSISFFITDKKNDSTRKMGDLILLPFVGDIEEREAVNLVLEDLLSLPQTTLPPEWLESISLPLIPEIQAAINEKRATITTLETEIAAKEKEKGALEKYRKLLYTDGSELENIFADCLVKCGGKVTPAKYSEEEFVLEHERDLYLIECKGVGKSVALTHVRQLFDYMTRFEEDERRAGKGILLGNAWKGLPISARGQADTIIFPNNVIARAQALGIALVSSVDFFHGFCRFLAGEVTGEAILDSMTSAVGVVDFKSL